MSSPSQTQPERKTPDQKRMERHQDLIENSEFLVNQERLLEISKGNQDQSKQISQFMEQYTKSAEWKKFREGFLSMNYRFKPEDVIKFQFCPATHTQSAIFFPKKEKILVCENHIIDKEMLATLVNYNMTIMYDHLRADINYKDCNQVGCVNIRATHIAKVCKPSDHNCFKASLKMNLAVNPSCKGKEDEVFSNVFSRCILDLSPINSLKTRLN